MAADILLFNANQVPVGRDQIQHIEMARDIGQRFNHLYGSDYFTLPEAAIEDNVATLPGLDGRKMSKSYDNTIPLWLPQKELHKAILGIVTNSQMPGEPKNPDESHIFSIYQAFASADETAAMRKAYADGIGWGDAKQKLFERIDAELAPLRERYEALVAAPERIEEALIAGGERARSLSRPLIARLRDVVGLRKLVKREGSERLRTVSPKKAAKVGRYVGPYPEGGSYKYRVENGKRDHLFVSREYTSWAHASDGLGHLKSMGPTDFELGRLYQIERPVNDLKDSNSGDLLGAVVLNGNPPNIALDVLLEELENLKNAGAND
jgi:tryptophanyl-tRNA synthetase